MGVKYYRKTSDHNNKEFILNFRNVRREINKQEFLKM